MYKEPTLKYNASFYKNKWKRKYHANMKQQKLVVEI